MPTRPKRPYTLKIDEDLLAALRTVKDRDGIPESEQIRRGIRLWLAARDAEGKALRRARTRRRL